MIAPIVQFRINFEVAPKSDVSWDPAAARPLLRLRKQLCILMVAA